MQFGNLMFIAAAVLILFIEGGLGLLGYNNEIRNDVLLFAFIAWTSFSIGGIIALFRLHDKRFGSMTDTDTHQ